MKKITCWIFLVMLNLCTSKANTNQFYFSMGSLPSSSGEYYCSYFSTDNVVVPAMLTLTTNSGGGIVPPGLGVVWDFSQSKQGNESVLRTDIISPTDGTDGSEFPDATFAEQDTSEIGDSTNQTGWRYYSLTNTGRIYYGLYTPNTDADGLAVLDPPNVDIPVTVTNGQTWTRSTAWNTTVFGFYGIYYEFADQATVDAEGTLALPGIGVLPALRVHEVHGYTGLLSGFGTVEIVTNQFYYWLVPGLGVAVQITLYGENQYDGEQPAFTNSVERMYYASYYTNPVVKYFPTTGNLNIQLQSGTALLSWTPFTNSTTYQVSTGYVVQAASSLAVPSWQSLGLTSTTNWSDNLTSTQRYYRVVGLP